MKYTINKVYTLILMLLCIVTANSWAQDNQKREVFVADLVSKMTLEEKVGQMTQVTLDVVCEGEMFDSKKIQKIDEVRLSEAFETYHLGSILNIGNHTKDRDKWYELIDRIQDVATKETRLGIPIIYGIDAIHGMNYTQGGTLFPQELGLAATWQPKFAKQMAEVTAYEVRASGISWNFSPVLDLGRQPLWSRFFETLGEDVHLANTMTEAIIQGYQGDDVSDPTKVAACMKHFVGYSNSKSGHDRTPIHMNERELRQHYLPTFEKAIENNAQTVMINSTEINGIPVHADYHLLTEVLKEELRFDGFAVTDWDDIKKLYHTHKIAASQKEAVKLAINAGIDMSMVPTDYSFCGYLVELVKEGEVPMSRIDDAVTRILRVKYNLGLFETTHLPKEYYAGFGNKDWQEWSYEAACESITLLKNENELLPLKTDDKLFVVGPTARSMNALNGAWTHSWQGTDTLYNTKGKLDILQAIRVKAQTNTIGYGKGMGYESNTELESIVKKAESSEVIVVCAGEAPATEKPGDINNLDLADSQVEMIKELSKLGKPVVLVLTEARPRIVREVEPLCDAIIMTYLPGDEGGRALASILYGEVNPSGKLPFTYPKFSGNLVTYDHKHSDEHGRWGSEGGFAPQWEFGHGLSYTHFEYSELDISDSVFTETSSIVLTMKVTNEGSRGGKEVVQLYSSDEVRSVTPPVKELIAYEKVELAVGETKRLRFELRADQFSFVNNDLYRVTEPGFFTLTVGKEKTRIRFDSVRDALGAKQ